MGDSLIRQYLQRKHPGMTGEYLLQRETLLQDALSSYTRRSGKVCGACTEFKALSAYGADASRSDGLSVYCRQCRK